MPSAITIDDYFGPAFATPGATSGALLCGWIIWDLPTVGKSEQVAPKQASATTATEDPIWLKQALGSIDRLQSLRHGWDGYGAGPIPRQAVHAAFQLLHWVSGFRTPPAAFVPTSTGDVQLEWHQHEMDIEVYFLGNTTVRTWVWDHRSNEESEVDISRDVAPLVAALQTLTNRADK